MILKTVKSKNGVPIRLTDERWLHITEAHQEIDANDFPKFMEVITNPDFILNGSKGEFLAIQKVPRKKLWLVVPYKELNQEDGFVLTSYFTSDLKWLFKKEIIWNKD